MWNKSHICWTLIQVNLSLACIRKNMNWSYELFFTKPSWFSNFRTPKQILLYSPWLKLSFQSGKTVKARPYFGWKSDSVRLRIICTSLQKQFNDEIDFWRVAASRDERRKSDLMLRLCCRRYRVFVKSHDPRLQDELIEIIACHSIFFRPGYSLAALMVAERVGLKPFS